MISNHPREKLVAIGARHRAVNVRAQGNFTRRLIEEDAPVLELVTPERLAELGEAIDKLAAAMKDRDIMEAESKDLTLDQGDAVQAAKLWRRTIVARAKAAAMVPVDVPADLLKIAGGRAVADVGRDVERLANLLTEDALALLKDHGITPELAERGRTLAAQLQEVDTDQDVARLARLPEKVKDMYVQKALVYLAAKQFNLLAVSVHIKDAHSRKKYNLDHLYEKVRSRKVDPPAPAEPPEEKKEPGDPVKT